MKQITPNPWEMISEKYPIGSTIEVKSKISSFGIFIGIDDDIDSLVLFLISPGSNASSIPRNVPEKGMWSRQKYWILINPMNGFPWASSSLRMIRGKHWRIAILSALKSTGRSPISQISVFLWNWKGIEGLVHVSEISKEKIKTPVGQYEVGDTISTKVMNINTEDRRIGTFH
ncbi:MAG: S1 RNA-binding domain-containing protein [Desulfobacterales bacterium]